jgi:hypothetical protein
MDGLSRVDSDDADVEPTHVDVQSNREPLMLGDQQVVDQIRPLE